MARERQYNTNHSDAEQCGQLRFSSWAALQSGALPKPLSHLGVLIGLISLLVFAVQLLQLLLLGLIWSVWLGLLLWRQPAVIDAALPAQA